MHGAVTYLFVIPLFLWSVVVLSLFLVWCLSFCFVPLFLGFLFFDAHKLPSSNGRHFARWFGARNVQILRCRGTLVLGVLCVS